MNKEKFINHNIREQYDIIMRNLIFEYDHAENPDERAESWDKIMYCMKLNQSFNENVEDVCYAKGKADGYVKGAIMALIGVVGGHALGDLFVKIIVQNKK